MLGWIPGLLRTLVCALVLLSTAATAAGVKLPPGSGRFDHSLADGRAIPVHYYVPAGAGADTPILFVMHGVNRDADRYRDEWISYADANGIAVFAPEFSQAQFPGAQGYNLGGIAEGGWPAGRETSAYTMLEGIFDSARTRLGSARERYFLYGHSAGAQFVHRFAYFMPDARVEAAIAANAGWYSMPDLTSPWPYGLAGTAMSKPDLARALAAPLVILLGSSDRDPAHPSLRTSDEAMAQGRHRLERGLGFIDAAYHASAPGAFGWTVRIVPGAAHNNAQMIPAAIAVIKERSR